MANEQVVCDAVAHLVPSDTGSECICEAGFVDTSPPGEGTSPAVCVACPIGQYKAATDSLCQVRFLFCRRFYHDSGAVKLAAVGSVDPTGSEPRNHHGKRIKNEDISARRKALRQTCADKTARRQMGGGSVVAEGCVSIAPSAADRYISHKDRLHPQVVVRRK